MTFPALPTFYGLKRQNQSKRRKRTPVSTLAFAWKELLSHSSSFGCFYSCFFFFSSVSLGSPYIQLCFIFILFIVGLGWQVAVAGILFFNLMAVKRQSALIPGLVRIFPERPTVAATSVTLGKQASRQCNQWAPARDGAGLRFSTSQSSVLTYTSDTEINSVLMYPVLLGSSSSIGSGATSKNTIYTSH